MNRAVVEIATKNNLFDTSIYSTYLEVKDLFESLPFIEPLFSAMSSYVNERNKPYINIVVDQFKYYKKRVNLNHYKIKLNEEVVDTPVNEELVNEIL